MLGKKCYVVVVVVGPQLLGFTGDKYIFLGLAKLVIVQDRDKKAFGKQMGIWFLTFYLKQPRVLFPSTSFCISVLLTDMGSSLVSKKNVLFPRKRAITGLQSSS